MDSAVGRPPRMGPETGREQFEALYRAHGRALLAYALRRVDRAEDAADVVAETMLVAWRRLPDVPAGERARLWLFGVARRVLANQRRGGRRRDRLGERLRTEVHRLVGDHALAVETNLVVATALARLDADDRDILRLTSWEGLQPGDIAVVLGVPAATARTRLHRARQRLRQQLAEAGYEETVERPAGGGHVDHDEQALVRDAEDER